MNSSLSIQFINNKSRTKSFDINLPASKSISNRILLLQHLYFPHLIIENLSAANDTVLMQQALKQLSEGKTINVEDAGTVARFISAAALFSVNRVLVTGTERMQQRPMNELIIVLEKLGASIMFLDKKGNLPFTIKGNIANINDSTPILLSISTKMSSQFLSALLMIAPKLKRRVTLQIADEKNSWSYVDMTIKMMRSLGFKIELFENTIVIEPFIPLLRLRSYIVENDWSSASFIIEILSTFPPQTTLYLKNLPPIEKSIQGDAVLCQWAQDFNLNFKADNNQASFEVLNEVNATSERSFLNNPDLALPYIVSMVLQKKIFIIKDVDSLQYKESDRMAAIQIELKKCHVSFKKIKDGYLIDASELDIKPDTVFNSHNDHRIAMCLAPLAIHVPITLLNPDVVNKSFPKYWDELIKLNFELINN